MNGNINVARAQYRLRLIVAWVQMNRPDVMAKVIEEVNKKHPLPMGRISPKKVKLPESLLKLK